MTKSDLIDLVAQQANLTLDRSAVVVKAFFDLMADAMKRGDRIEIRNFGNFIVKQYDGYEGRNPRTGAAVKVGPKKLPFFKAGLGLKVGLNERKGKR